MRNGNYAPVTLRVLAVAGVTLSLGCIKALPKFGDDDGGADTADETGAAGADSSASEAGGAVDAADGAPSATAGTDAAGDAGRLDGLIDVVDMAAADSGDAAPTSDGDAGNRPNGDALGASLVWKLISLTGGPVGLVLDSSAVINYDPGSNRLIAFYASNPSASSQNGTESQVWILEHANGVDGDPAWLELAVTGTFPDDINGDTTAVYTPQNELLVYGGCTFNCSPAQQHVYRLTNANGLGGATVWTRLNIATPRPRSGHQSAFDPTTKNMISFGGNQAFFGTDENDTAVLDLSTLSWTTLDVGTTRVPPARSEAFSAAYDADLHRLIVFGGNHLISSSSPVNIVQYNDLWVLANANGVGTPAWQLVSPTGAPPQPRAGNAAVFDAVHDRLLIFGGSSWSNQTQVNTPLDDLWQVTNLSGIGGQAAWSRLSFGGDDPGPMTSVAAAFDGVSQRLMLLGPGDPTKNVAPKFWLLELQ